MTDLVITDDWVYESLLAGHGAGSFDGKVDYIINHTRDVRAWPWMSIFPPVQYISSVSCDIRHTRVDHRSN